MTDEEMLVVLPLANRRSGSMHKQQRRSSARQCMLNMFLLRNNSLPIAPQPLTPQNANSAKFPDLQQQLRKAELEKEIILRKLETLRSGAVSALAEKSRQIERLKEMLADAELPKKDDEHSDRTYQCSLRLQQVGQNIVRLKQELQVERETFFVMVAKRDKMICELGEELQQNKSEIARVEHNTQQLSSRLREVEGENQSLHDELLRSKSSISVLRESLKGTLGANNTSNNGELGSESQFSELINRLFTEESQSQKSGYLPTKEQSNSQPHHENRLKMQLHFNKKQRERRKRELAEYQLHYESLLNQQSILKPKKSGDYPTTEQFSERSYGSMRLSYSDLRNEIKMIENYQVGSVLQLERKCASAGNDNESEFSVNHFNYQLREEENNSVGSLKTMRQRTRTKLSHKEPAPVTQLDEISEASNDVSFCKPPSKWSGYRLFGIVAGVLASAAVIKLAFRLCR